MIPKFLLGVKHIHILGIAGTMTTPLALELIKLGIKVTGSDQDKIYPPVSTILSDANIPINITPITSNIDLVIVGGSYNKFKQTQAEFSQVVAQKIKYISASSFLGLLMEAKNPIIVTGTFGKTTISSALSWALLKLGANPTYFFGGFPVNHFPSLQQNLTDYSVIEAGEDINGLDKGPKFDYYPLKHLLITSADWEHRESYATQEQNFTAFSNLVKRLTPDSTFVYNPASKSAKQLAASFPNAIPYDLSLSPVIQTSLIGQANLENLIGATTMLVNLGFPKAKVIEALSTFEGIRRRLEVVYSGPGLVIIDDFAQSDQRVLAALNAVKGQYPNYKIITFFEPHATSLLYKSSVQLLAKSLEVSDSIILGPLTYSSSISKIERATPEYYRQLLGAKLTYLPDYEAIIQTLSQPFKEKTVIVHFSSGGQIGLNSLSQIVNAQKSATI
jgi:UDP-N-acetylmuramate: L-alanyl-gamma-D-glutamyl-meso-diaminopimelate ligase